MHQAHNIGLSHVEVVLKQFVGSEKKISRHKALQRFTFCFLDPHDSFGNLLSGLLCLLLWNPAISSELHQDTETNQKSNNSHVTQGLGSCSVAVRHERFIFFILTQCSMPCQPRESCRGVCVETRVAGRKEQRFKMNDEQFQPFLSPLFCENRDCCIQRSHL